MTTNYLDMNFQSISRNTSFVRATIGAFLSSLDLNMEELYDIKMAVSEAVTNAILHGYKNDPHQLVQLTCSYQESQTHFDITITVTDTGAGITNIDQARQAMFTTSEDAERAGLGFTVMETIMDAVEISSKVDVGTTVTLHMTVQK
ncbi:anti-sigma F factor [Candidatus Epulonipiscium viviparus]|uniref:anti-sigma F factor n=1 Tax=Candidatus Epulonipiscium viviparus TaxID=420336 RepID=UPI00016BFD9F|nr:anti-sigma F factor [Candidatus Epulopiscium viviparus]